MFPICCTRPRVSVSWSRSRFAFNCIFSGWLVCTHSHSLHFKLFFQTVFDPSTMPPSARHRHFLSAHDVLSRHYTRRGEAMISENLANASVAQGLFAIPSNQDIVPRKQIVAGQSNSVVIITLIFLLSITAFVIIGISLVLIRHRQKLNSSKHSCQETASTVEVGSIVIEKRGVFGRWMNRKHGCRFILHQGQGGLVLSQNPPPSNLRGILMTPKEYHAHKAHQMEPEGQEKEPVSPFTNNYRIPTMAFDRISPSVPAPRPTATRGHGFEYDGPNDYMVDGSVSILISEDMSSSSSSDSSEYTSANRRSDFTIAEYQRSRRSLTNTSDTEESSGPLTPNQDRLEPQTQITSQDGLIAENQSREFFSRLRGLIPKPPSAKFSAFTISPTSNVRRSFTAPAFFSIVSTENKRASIVSLKPDSTHERESVTSNFLLKLFESQTKNERSLLDEAFPPPSIIVSPPTASTINSGIQRRSWLGPEGDVWCQAYRMNIASEDKATEIPPEYHLELTKKSGSMEAPPRPLKSPRRTSVQALVDGMDLL